MLNKNLVNKIKTFTKNISDPKFPFDGDDVERLSVMFRIYLDLQNGNITIGEGIEQLFELEKVY